MKGTLLLFHLGKNPSSFSPETLLGIMDLTQFLGPIFTILKLFLTHFSAKYPFYKPFLVLIVPV